MQIKFQNQDSEGSFYAEEAEKRIGEIRFTLFPDNQLEIYHTEVSSEHQGQHIGERLVEAVADYARREGKKVIPSCTFAKTVFARNADFKDVLA
jgi:uncharacterized protein